MRPHSSRLFPDGMGLSEADGHATIAVTFDTFSHVLPNMQGEAVSAMESALLPSLCPVRDGRG